MRGAPPDAAVAERVCHHARGGQQEPKCREDERRQVWGERKLVGQRRRTEPRDERDRDIADQNPQRTTAEELLQRGAARGRRERRQGLGKVVRGCKAIRRRLGHRPDDGLIDVRRDRRSDGLERGDLVGHVARDDLAWRAHERWVARDHLVEHAAERVHVAPTVEVGVAGGLLRTHVRRRADGHPRLRQLLSGRVHRPRNAEVDQNGTSRQEQNVLGFDIAVDDVLLMRVVQRHSYLTRNVERIVNR